jgi:hypothetical protein
MSWWGGGAVNVAKQESLFQLGLEMKDQSLRKLSTYLG